MINLSYLIRCLLTLLISGCSVTEFSALKGAKSLKCEDVVSLSVGLATPEYHYEKMLGCIQALQYKEAALHYAIAGVRTWYDYLVNPDLNNEERHNSVLRKKLERLSHQQTELFWLKLNLFLQEKKTLNEFCIRMVFPEHHYYIPSFWEEAKSGYLHCKNIKISSKIV